MSRLAYRAALTSRAVPVRWSWFGAGFRPGLRTSSSLHQSYMDRSVRCRMLGRGRQHTPAAHSGPGEASVAPPLAVRSTGSGTAAPSSTRSPGPIPTTSTGMDSSQTFLAVPNDFRVVLALAAQSNG
jgi:hypothetical protein